VSFLVELACPRCGARHPADRLTNVCPCGSPLLAEYDVEGMRRSWDREALARRPATLWRYAEALPVRDPAARVSLGEGWTPLLPLPRLGARLGFHDLWLKDEGANPTGTFKARGAAVGVSRARELGARALALPTAGNAGGAWAAYAARAGLPLTVAMPWDAPRVNQREAVVYGARTWLVRGLISDAGALIARHVAETGAFDASTLREPYRVEGKKTMGYEILEQLGWRPPAAVVCPVGGGVGLIGIWRAWRELQALGWLDRREVPRLVAVQAEGCRPLVAAWERGEPLGAAWPGAATIAAGLRVPRPLGEALVLQALRETGGTALAVADAEIAEAMRAVAAQEGLWICPEGAAAVAALPRLRAQGFLAPSDRVVVLNTGSGVKYAELVEGEPPVLEPGAPPPPDPC
jgi:threonine synthase